MSAEEAVVSVDRLRCAGTGLCAATAPADLELAADGRARARRERTGAVAEVVEAAELCPMEAITVHRAATGEKLAPTW
ncbi:ferredoxin [Kitasatospora sp. NBC_01287]|uniref:ferredoxin n=1 Tax=Kitasatospora sp. NBC_01287 TaxID=2903573 RepID=UPI00224D80A9|nr:ferredoxin [Kitasatospora sp. NBC_01287]MCX4750240.1 ferredoxin [Kitasatospora sp. NBC_01287]